MCYDPMSICLHDRPLHAGIVMKRSVHRETINARDSVGIQFSHIKGLVKIPLDRQLHVDRKNCDIR